MKAGALTLLVLCASSVVTGLEITHNVPAKTRRCFGEELAKQELLVAEFTSVKNQKLTVVIQDSHNQIFGDHEKVHIKTAFTTQVPGPHWICIQNEDETDEAEVKMELKAGAAAKDYSQVAKKDHLEPLQVTLRKVEDTLKTYHQNVLYMREREERMRLTTDSTGLRVISLCLFSVILMIGVGGWQMFYFKHFFRSKKII